MLEVIYLTDKVM